MNITEKKTVGKMIHIYCAAKHGTSHALCTTCAELHQYSQRKLSSCKYKENKPTCQKCSTHCYKPEMREKIRGVMRYSGLRMIFKSPVLAFSHLLKSIKG